MTTKTPILGLNRFEFNDTQSMDTQLASHIRRRHRTQGENSVLFYKHPIEMVSARGTWMTDSYGNRYLDMYNNVPSVGHSHPRVVEAMTQQALLLNTNTRYLFSVLENYSEALLETFPDDLSNIIFTCTGSESNDIALRMARMVTGKQGIIVTENAYHGNTSAVMEVSPSGHKRQQLPPYVKTIAAPDPRTLPMGISLAEKFAEDVRQAALSLESAGYGSAALLVDTIFSSDGVFADPVGFLAGAVEVIHQFGGVFIADEVQPGFGRTGSHYWCFQRHGIVPDIVTLGKPMGNGYPMSAVITRPDILATFNDETEYFNTFGGNPVAAAVGMSVLNVIKDEGLLENASRNGLYLREGLSCIARDCTSISAIRGAGLFNGVEFTCPEAGGPDTPLVQTTINRLRDEGVLIGAAGTFGNILKIRSPLCFSQEDADFFLDKLGRVLKGLRPT